MISFRLQAGLADVGDDPIRKSKLVNEIAESISKINKAEDFALQEHYIRIAAAKLKVDETGLITLVNKYIRDRVDQDNKNKRRDTPQVSEEDMATAATYETEPQIQKPATDETQEWQLLRILIEYGHLAYEGYDSVAKLIEERVDPALLEQPLVGKLYNEYFDHLTHFGATPEMHYFINYPDPSVRERLASLLHTNIEISPNWKDKYGIDSLHGGLLYVTDVDSTLSYFELKKILLLQEELTQRLNTETDDLKQQRMQIKFLELRKLEREILKKEGIITKITNISNTNKYILGRIIALDFGKNRTGVAVTDPLQIIATAIDTVDSNELIGYLKKYIATEPVEKIIIGYPLNFDGTPTDATPLVEKFIRKFANVFPDMPVEKTDERLTSKMASKEIAGMGLKKKDREKKELIDAVTAVMMLQEYLLSTKK